MKVVGKAVRVDLVGLVMDSSSSERLRFDDDFREIGSMFSVSISGVGCVLYGVARPVWR